MCRLHWGTDYFQDDAQILDKEVSGHFVDVLGKMKKMQHKNEKKKKYVIEKKKLQRN